MTDSFGAFRRVLWRLLLISALASLTGPPTGAQEPDGVGGTWEWRGPGGWQRLTLDLETDGEKLSGTIAMGPGGGSDSFPPERLWEHFFEPVVFEISGGRIDGNQIRFEQRVNDGERLRYSGSVEAGRLHLVRESERPGRDPWSLGDHRVELTLERVASGTLIFPTPVPGPAEARNRVSLDAVVVDPDGNVVNGLVGEDFQVLEAGTGLEVLSVSGPGTPWNVLLLLDRTLARAGGPDYLAGTWNRTLGALTGFLATLRPEDRISVALFEDRVETVLDWRELGTSGQQSIDMNALLKPAQGAKDVYRALDWAVDEMSGLADRKLVIVITDGRDGRLWARWLRKRNDPGAGQVLDPLFGLPDAGERAAFQETLETLAGADLRFVFVATQHNELPEFPASGQTTTLPTPANPFGIARANLISGLFPGSAAGISAYLGRVRERLGAFADATGGVVLYPNTPQEALDRYSRLHDELALENRYTLVVGDSGRAISPEAIEVRTRDPALRVVPMGARGADR